VNVADIIPPTARAGDDVTVDEGSFVSFDGSGSFDNVGVVAFEWTFEIGGETVNLTGPNPNYLVDLPGEFEVTLTVSDAFGNTGSEMMVIHSRDVRSPRARAGPDVHVDQHTWARLDGSSSTDGGGIASYVWTFEMGGRSHTLSGARVDVRCDVAGAFTVRLEVTDLVGFSSTDTLQLHVRDVDPPVLLVPSTIEVPRFTRVVLDATRSTDNVGIVNYTWSFEHGGEGFNLFGGRVWFTFDVPGLYPVIVTALDAQGNRVDGSMTVVVLDTVPLDLGEYADRRAPKGANVTFRLASGLDPQNISQVTWTISYSGAEVVLEGDRSSHEFEAIGRYVVTLRVVGTDGRSGTARLNVTVLDNESPWVSLGPDQEVAMGTTVVLEPSDAGDDVGIASYNWSFTYEGSEVLSQGPVLRFVFDHVGTFALTLTVEDAEGHQASAVVNVTVLDTEAPVALGGGDRTVLEGDLLSLDGSRSHDNAGMSSFSWDIYHMGGHHHFEGENVTYLFAEAGAYRVVLTVSDEAGNQASDEMFIDVLEAPGGDQPGQGDPLESSGGGSRGPDAAVYGTSLIVVIAAVASALLILRRR
jgi:PKD repeat protein